MLSDSRTHIKDIRILTFDLLQEHPHHEDPHGFESFIKSFSTLTNFHAKICQGWQLDSAIWKRHPNLIQYDVDLGNSQTLSPDAL
jgi:hypothetical protein